MADLLDSYDAELNKRSESYGDYVPQQFLDLDQGLGMKTPIGSTEFPGLGSDFGGMDRYLEEKAQGIYEVTDRSVLENQAASGNERAINELKKRRAEEFRAKEKQLVDSKGGLNTMSFIDIPPVDMSGLEDITTRAEETAEKKRAAEAEAFRAKEKQLVDSKGGLNTMSLADSAAITQDNIEQASIAAMNDYIEAARGAGPEVSPVKDIKDYKEKFAEATGIDISGEVDKSHALMTFGLALMQNKAGKGFNVGKMLTATGEAGQAAMPALEKARERTRLDSIAAGKYALESQSADEAKALAAREKAMERSNYFVVPKSKDVKGFLANLSTGQGRLESLSKYELDKLRKNPEFTSKFDVLPGATWSSVVTEAMKTPEASELYLTKNPNSVPLFEGAGDTLTIRTFSADPNKNPGGQPILDGDGQDKYQALARMARDARRAKEQFIELGVLTDKNRNVFTYGVDTLNSLGAAFGVKFTDDMTETSRIKMVLEKLAMKNAPSILGESGKTISDGDRERVERIVGTLDAFGDIRTVRKKVEELFNDIVLSSEADISQGLTTLDRLTGRKVGSALSDGELTENERKIYEADMAALGIKL
tara:strand:+ start:55 stop:1836 length:1782 start_codon:yes stop_codon:yes gene_type:complete